MVVLVSKRFPTGPLHGPLPSLKGSELWAPVLQVVFHGVKMDLHGFRIRGLY